MKIFVLFLFLGLPLALRASSDLPVSISKASPAQTTALLNALPYVSSILPAKFKAGLPKSIFLKVEKLTDDEGIPQGICEKENDKRERPFIYGEYNRRTNTLVLNTAVVNELMRVPDASPKINCQHKSLYQQAISAIVHELAHAYDFNGNNISSSAEFFQRAGFKRGLLKVKNKNIEAMRPADPYELQSAVEAFAVNAEYFFMDDEFACRRPAMFDYLKNVFGAETTRFCKINRTVMMSTTSGLYPIKLDPSRVYRIDYLMAAPGKELSSGFGHSMFRIVMCAPEHVDPITNAIIPATSYGKKCLEDRLFHLVVSYRANVEDATLNYLKGLFGGYPSMMFILNFSDVLDEYNRDELRDVISYPLNLSSKEKLDFLNKVLEDHWNYRGSYKFVTNNCAVESYNLLKSALDRSQLNNYHSVSPEGVLDDLDRMEFVSIKRGDQETFQAHSDQLRHAYAAAYGYRERNTKRDQDALLKFIKESSVDARKTVFEKFKGIKAKSQNLHDAITGMKNRLVAASSFSVLEQQIFRFKTAEFRKKAAELLMNSKDDNIQEMIKESEAALKIKFDKFSRNGYGVPLEHEMLAKNEIENGRTSSKEAMVNIEAVLKEKMPEEIALLQTIDGNINIFNQYSIALRKSYRENLERYIAQVIKNLSLEDEGRILLAKSLSSKTDLDKIRELLDFNLVSEKEVLDVKLRRIISETLDIE